MKKAISLFLVVSILLLSGNMFAQERKGADLSIQKKDGQQVRGELIAVKQDSLLLLERDSGADMTITIDDIRVITIVKKSQLFLGVLAGSLIGGVAGALIGSGKEEHPPATIDLFVPVVIDFDFPSERTYTTGIGLGLGAFIGGIFGISAGKDKTIQIEGKSDTEIAEILEKLRKKARIRNAR